MVEVTAPAWLTYDQVIAMHSRQLRRFGGAPGLRDEGLLRSALERPVNKWHYEQADLGALAAAYAFGLAKNHAFVDGNNPSQTEAYLIHEALHSLGLGENPPSPKEITGRVLAMCP